jgi:hypothetical protein
MARHYEADEGGGRSAHDRRDFIGALLHHRGPPPVDDRQLLKRIESKTAQHRSPFSANISRKHASILSAISDDEKPVKLGHQRSLTPTREASRRNAFEVFEWEREKEPIEVAASADVPTSEEQADIPGWEGSRPVLTKYMAGLGDDDEEPEAEPEPEVEPEEEIPEEPEVVPEAVDLITEDILEEAKSLAPQESEDEEEPEPEVEEEPEPEVEEEPTPEVRVVPEPTPQEEVVVEGRPGHMPREGGEFPEDLMEPIDEAETEGSARLDLPRRDERPEISMVAFEHETDFSDESEEPPGETETAEAVEGLRPTARWPSDTGLELHIDGFEHIATTSDLCPRCGRRVTARNRLLTCNDCGTVACESCEIKTMSEVDSPYYYEWKFDLPLCVNCYEKAFNIQKLLAKAEAALGMGNHTYAFYHAQQALRTDPTSPYAKDAQKIIDQVDRRRREAAEQDEAWKRQRAKLSRTTVVRED